MTRKSIRFFHPPAGIAEFTESAVSAGIVLDSTRRFLAPSADLAAAILGYHTQPVQDAGFKDPITIGHQLSASELVKGFALKGAEVLA